MRNRWGVEIKKGNWVRYKLVRGGEAEGYIRSIDRKGPMAGAYGPWINLTNGQSCSADDITETLGPMTVSKGGVVRQNPIKGTTYFVAANMGYGVSKNFKVTATPGVNSVRSAANIVAKHLGFPVFVSSRNEGSVDGYPLIRFEFMNDDQSEFVDLFASQGKREDRKYSTIKNNPLTRIKVKSPPQRPTGTATAPGKRLVARRKKTAIAPKGFYANPVESRIKGRVPKGDSLYVPVFRVSADSTGSGTRWNLLAQFYSASTAKQYARAYAAANPKSSVLVEQDSTRVSR